MMMVPTAAGLGVQIDYTALGREVDIGAHITAVGALARPRL
jgi:hypothetical protein